jgi:hypothetical protein
MSGHSINNKYLFKDFAGVGGEKRIVTLTRSNLTEVIKIKHETR